MKVSMPSELGRKKTLEIKTEASYSLSGASVISLKAEKEKRNPNI